MAHIDVHALILGTHENVHLYVKRVFADVILDRTLENDYPVSSRWAQTNHESLKERTCCGQRERYDDGKRVREK